MKALVVPAAMDIPHILNAKCLCWRWNWCLCKQWTLDGEHEHGFWYTWTNKNHFDLFFSDIFRTNMFWFGSRCYCPVLFLSFAPHWKGSSQRFVDRGFSHHSSEHKKKIHVSEQNPHQANRPTKKGVTSSLLCSKFISFSVDAFSTVVERYMRSPNTTRYDIYIYISSSSVRIVIKTPVCIITFWG